MAARRQTTTYGDIAEEIKVAARAAGGLCLDPILCYCEATKLPNLASIVVNRITGEPEDNYRQRESLYRDRECVYEFPWLDYAPPTIDELKVIESE